MKKRFLACLLAVCMLVAMLPTVAFAGNVTYVDLGGHWCEEPIYKWSAKGIVNGVGKDANGGDLFDPDGLLTREQAAAIFARLLKLEEVADVSFFKDVAAGQWYVDGIAKCYAAGIIKGTGIDTFGTGAYLTRADMFTMFCRALGIEEQDACDKVFDDAREVPVYAKEYTNALVNLGYVGGVTATTLQPLANITRAQMVALLDKAIVGYITEDGEYEIDEDGIVLVVGEGLDVALSGKGAVSAVVTGDETEIDVTDMDDAEDVVIVVKGANNVKAKASVGTTIVTMDAEDTTVNGEDLDKSDEIVVEEEKKPASSGSSSSDRNDRCTHRYAYETDAEGHREYCYKCDEWTDAWEDHEFEQIATESGYKYVCAVCDYVCEHDWSDLIVDRLPTCEEEGSEHIECEYCGAKRGKNTAALGHIDENDDNICDRDASHILCADNDHISEVIPGKAATCTETGLTAGTKCSVCGEILTEQEEIPATGEHVDTDGDCVCDVCEGAYHPDEDENDVCDNIEGICNCEEVTDEDENGVCDTCVKFYLAVSSGSTKVSATAYDDYSAQLIIPGTAVDASNVTLEAVMQNVDSLGVDGVREHELNVATGLSGKYDLETYLDATLAFEEETKINVTIGEADAFTYTVTGAPVAGDDENYGHNIITATPDNEAAARAAWAELTSYVTTGSDGADSKIIIANGSYLTVGAETLEFETEDDLVLNGLDDLDGLKEDIKNNVKLTTGEASEDIVAYLAKGSTLAVGSSYAVLDENAKIVVKAVEVAGTPLADIRDNADSTKELVKGLIYLLDDVVEAVEGKTIDVIITFEETQEEEEPAEPVEKFQVKVSSGETETENVSATVYSDYSIYAKIYGGAVDTNDLTIYAMMQDVDGLDVEGKREHELNVNTQLGAKPDLDAWLKNTMAFEGATVEVDVDDAKFTYGVVGKAYTGDDDNYDTKVITAEVVDGDAAAAWAELMKHVEPSTGSNDSEIIIAKDSYLYVGTGKLVAEEKLTLDNISDLEALDAAVRAAVALETVEGSDVVEIYLTAGTTLTIGSSSVVLEDDATITIEGVTVTEDILFTIRDAANTRAMVKNLVQLFDEIVGTMSGTIKITVAF